MHHPRDPLTPQSHRHSIRISHITRDRTHLRTLDLHHPTRTGQQHQTTHPMRLHQMTGDQTTQRPRRPGDHHRPTTEPRHPRRPHPDQTRNPHHPVPQHRLRHRTPHILRRVQQMNTIRMLRLRRPHQTPQRRTVRIRDHLTHRTERPHHQPRTSPRGISQPPLKQPQQSHRPIPSRTRNRRIHQHHRHRSRKSITQPHHHRSLDRRSHPLLRHPLHTEQQPVRRTTRHLPRRNRPQCQCVDPGHRQTRLVGEQHAHGVGGGPCREPHSQGVGGRAEQAYAREGERQLSTVGGRQQVTCSDGVQGRVEQRRVYAETVGRLVDRDLREHRRTVPPDPSQPTEDRAVGQPRVRERLVQSVDAEFLDTGRRPDDKVGVLGGGGVVRGENTGRVQRPGCFVVGPGVDGNLVPSVSVRSADRGADLRAVAHRQGQWCLEQQFVEDRRPDAGSAGECHLDQGSAGDDRDAVDRVVGQPRVGTDRQPACENRLRRVWE